jgi:hypothetical protein
MKARQVGQPVTMQDAMGPRQYDYVLLVNDGITLLVHRSPDPAVIAYRACQEFGGEADGPANWADALDDLTRHGESGVRYSAPDIGLKGVAFWLGADIDRDELCASLNVIATDLAEALPDWA